jgi:hypothetical protein
MTAEQFPVLCLWKPKRRHLITPILQNSRAKRHLVHIGAYFAAPIGSEPVELLVVLISIASGIALEVRHADMRYHVNVPQLRKFFEQIE